MIRRWIWFLSVAPTLLAADGDFNGRWNIQIENEPRRRVWWLEINGAGTAGLLGRFVGAPGGDLENIPEITVKDGELRFVFRKRYLRGGEGSQRGVYTARLSGGQLQGTFTVEGTDAKPLLWTGRRAPDIPDKDDGTWRAGKRVSLFNGRDLSDWAPLVPGQKLGWSVENGVMKNVAGANNIVSARTFWNFEIDAEFRVGPKSNGGIGLRGRYEVQILEDFGRPPSSHGNGALYSRIAPSMNASRPPWEWQTYRIRLVGREVTVVLNGKTVIDRGVVEGLTAMASDAEEDKPGPIVLQGDHGPVEFRRIVVTPLTRP